MSKNLLLPCIFFCASVFASPDFWTQKTSLPAQPRAGAVAFAKDGFGYVGTGLDSMGNLLNDFWQYDPVNDSWSQAASFPGSGRKNAVAFVTDSFAYVGTGYDSTGLTKDFYRFDTQNNSWQRINDVDSAGLTYPRRDATAFAIGSKGYVVGGYDGTSFYSSNNWEYDGSRDTVWKQRTVFPVFGRRWSTAFSIGGNGYVGMGFNYSQEYFHDLWKYDGSANAWTQMADYPGNKRGYAVSFVISSFAFVGTGSDGTYDGDFYIYDGTSNQWGPVATFGGLPTSAAVAFSVNGKGYVFGGVDTLGMKNELWEYTPDNTLGLDHPVISSAFTVSPNPASHSLYVNFSFDNNQKYQFLLFDSSGKRILSQNISPAEKTVNIDAFRPGMYYYSISLTGAEKSSVTGKVILQ